MTFSKQPLANFVQIEKGLTYKGDGLVEDSEVALIGMDSFIPGGGYKAGSEKPYSGPYKAGHTAEAGDLILCATDVTQDGSVLSAPLLVPEDLGGYETLVYSHHVCKVKVVNPGIRQEFIYNFFRIPLNRVRCAYGDTGTTVRALPYEVIYDQRIPVPSLEEQDRINSFIATLDRKIQLNTAMAETLEKIAQSVFRSWFIDFDPVKAKMAGENPVGMDDATAVLFPDSMEDSELGPIPTNWSIAPLTDFFDVLSGGTPRTSEKSYWDGPIPWFSVVDAPESGGCFFIKTEKTITELGVSRSAAKVVRPGVTIISARGTVGKTVIVATPSTFNQSCYGLMGKCGDFFTFLLVRYMVAKLQNIAHGGMFDTITRDTFSALSFPKPTETVIQLFEKAVEPMFREIMNLQYQSEQISMIRDSLLPRLISGELQIPEEALVS